MGGKGLRVNVDKTKVLMSGLGLDVLQKSSKDPCGMCLKGVLTNSIFCGIYSVGSTRDAEVSLVFGHLIPALVVNSIRDRPGH